MTNAEITSIIGGVSALAGVAVAAYGVKQNRAIATQNLRISEDQRLSTYRSTLFHERMTFVKSISPLLAEAHRCTNDYAANLYSYECGGEETASKEDVARSREDARTSIALLNGNTVHAHALLDEQSLLAFDRFLKGCNRVIIQNTSRWTTEYEAEEEQSYNDMLAKFRAMFGVAALDPSIATLLESTQNDATASPVEDRDTKRSPAQTFRRKHKNADLLPKGPHAPRKEPSGHRALSESSK